jgi:uncharacterized protein
MLKMDKTMKTNLTLFITSFLFGIGLELSQMNNPKKVYGFLNIFREWDPSLAFVMMGAILVNASIYIWVKRSFLKKQRLSLLGEKFTLPHKSNGDSKLIIGSAIFGIGWGLAGFCPGPAISGLFRHQIDLYIIAASMMAGMFIYELGRKFKLIE